MMCMGWVSRRGITDREREIRDGFWNEWVGRPWMETSHWEIRWKGIAGIIHAALLKLTVKFLKYIEPRLGLNEFEAFIKMSWWTLLVIKSIWYRMILSIVQPISFTIEFSHSIVLHHQQTSINFSLLQNINITGGITKCDWVQCPPSCTAHKRSITTNNVAMYY